MLGCNKNIMPAKTHFFPRKFRIVVNLSLKFQFEQFKP
jgi:hypothetical protein